MFISRLLRSFTIGKTHDHGQYREQKRREADEMPDVMFQIVHRVATHSAAQEREADVSWNPCTYEGKQKA